MVKKKNKWTFFSTWYGRSFGPKVFGETLRLAEVMTPAKTLFFSVGARLLIAQDKVKTYCQYCAEWCWGIRWQGFWGVCGFFGGLLMRPFGNILEAFLIYFFQVGKPVFE